ncbi:MAG: hypothetical protein PVH61_20080 [Candidatus Aminicenantes bacterium]
MRNLTLSESKKHLKGLFKDGLIATSLSMLLLLSVAMVFVGGFFSNKSLVNSKKRFIEIEETREKFYPESGNHNASLYHGFRILYVPPAINLLLGVNKANMALRVSLGKEYIWEKIEPAFILVRNVNVISISIFFILAGMIIMLYLGFVSYNRIHRLHVMFEKAILRMIIMDLSIGILLVFIFYTAKLLGIDISSSDGTSGKYLGLYSLLLLNLFFAFGFFMGMCLKDKIIAVAIGGFCCFFLIFIAPEFISENIYKDFFHDSNESSENLDLKRFKDRYKYINAVTVTTGEEKNDNGKKNEKPLTKEWMENIKQQRNAIKRIKAEYYSYENQVLLIPTNFWIYLLVELTGDGVTGYLNFLDHGLQLKKDLVKKYNHEDTYINIVKIDKRLEKVNQYIYKDESRIPESYFQATLMIIYYTIILFLISLLITLIQRRLRKIKNKKNKDTLAINTKNYFYNVLSCSGTRLCLVPERNPMGADIARCCLPLFVEMEIIKDLFPKLKNKDFWSFYSDNPEEMADFFNERPNLWGSRETPPTADELQPEQWFSPEQGLETVRALIDAVKNDLDWLDLKFSQMILEKLRDMEKFLSKAKEHGVRWHLTVDIYKRPRE